MLVVRRRWSACTAWWYGQVPTGFLPIEDQGYIIASVQLPDAASQARTREVTDQINEILAKTPGVDDLVRHRRPVAARRQRGVERGDGLRARSTTGTSARIPALSHGSDPRQV